MASAHATHIMKLSQTSRQFSEMETTKVVSLNFTI